MKCAPDLGSLTSRLTKVLIRPSSISSARRFLRSLVSAQNDGEATEPSSIQNTNSCGGRNLSLTAASISVGSRNGCASTQIHTARCETSEGGRQRCNVLSASSEHVRDGLAEASLRLVLRAKIGLGFLDEYLDVAVANGGARGRSEHIVVDGCGGFSSFKQTTDAIT